MNLIMENHLKTIVDLVKTKKYIEAEGLLSILIVSLENGYEEAERKKFLSEAYNVLGQVMYKKVEFEKAVDCYRKACGLDSSFASPFYNRGTIFYRLGLYEAALKDMRRAVELDPTNPEFLNGLQATEDAYDNSSGSLIDSEIQ